MSLADKVRQLKQEQEAAENAGTQENKVARDKIVSAAFAKVAKREDDLAAMLLNESEFLVPLSEYASDGVWTFMPRLMGAKINDKSVVTTIDEACVSENKIFQSLVKQFEEAGYCIENSEVFTQDFSEGSAVKTLCFKADISPVSAV